MNATDDDDAHQSWTESWDSLIHFFGQPGESNGGTGSTDSLDSLIHEFTGRSIGPDDQIPQ